MPDSGPRGWHSRGYLLHFDGGEVAQLVTFRLANSLPAEQLEAWRQALQHLPAVRADAELRERIERYLGTGVGEAWLGDPAIACLVEGALLYFDGERYRLHAWVVMPNHVHTLLTPLARQSLSRIVHAWKSFTAKKANQTLGREGAFWQPDYFDRFVRSQEHFDRTVGYVESNPVKAGLCASPEAWPFGSARCR